MAGYKKSNFKKVDNTNKDFKKPIIKELASTDLLDNRNIIGCDETGVGDYLTPLVACAVYVEAQNIDELVALGVKDSKLMTDDKIKEVAAKIKPLVKYRVNHLTQKGYNNLNKYLNAHELKMFLHLKSITQLEKIDKVEEDFILLDQFTNVSSLEKYYEALMLTNLKTDEIQKPLFVAEKAEGIHIAVAAGSIIGRDFFLEMMAEQEESCEMKFPLGTNEKVEQTALKFIEKFGRKALYEIAKISFKTTEKIDAILKEKEE